MHNFFIHGIYCWSAGTLTVLGAAIVRGISPLPPPISGTTPATAYKGASATMRKRILAFIDILLSPFVLAAACVLRFVRHGGIENMPLSRRVLLAIGVFPIEDHYYEPLFNFAHLKRKFDDPRSLPGIDWELESQHEFVAKLAVFANDVPSVPTTSFGGADADVWYCLLRSIKPQTVIEVGCGTSTVIAHKALMDNGGAPVHICVEPYEAPWLEQIGVEVLRERIEDVDKGIFARLRDGDVLFIDSSHVIRPQGDVTTLILEVLPILAPGVIVHFHDIFSPRDYHKKWIVDEIRLWNEQYLLEGFLTNNREWEIIAALNSLKHDCPQLLERVSCHFAANQEPGSLYIRKRDIDRKSERNNISQSNNEHN